MAVNAPYLRHMRKPRFEIDPALIEQAKAIAKAEHRSLTAHINLLIAEDIRKRERKSRKQP